MKILGMALSTRGKMRAGAGHHFVIQRFALRLLKRTEYRQMNNGFISTLVALLACVIFFGNEGQSAEIRLAEAERTDNLNNGSIDVQGASGGQLIRHHLISNMGDEGEIICNSV
jgi:hypothetical protein